MLANYLLLCFRISVLFYLVRYSHHRPGLSVDRYTFIFKLFYLPESFINTLQVKVEVLVFYLYNLSEININKIIVPTFPVYIV